MFTFTPLTTEEMLPYLGFENTATQKQRKAAYERVHVQLEKNERSLVTVAAGTTKKLLIRTSKDLTAGAVRIFEVNVAPNATLALTYFEDRPEIEHSLAIIKVTLQEGAALTYFAGITGSSSSSLFLDVIHSGTGSTSSQKTIFFGNHTQQLDTFSSTVLDAPDTATTIIVKGALSDHAQARFDGSIHITPNGNNAAGHLHEHTLLLSPNARVNAIPALKIAHNNVQASHAASVTRVDDEHLFYCGARGIDETMATKLIVDGFLGAIYRETELAEELEPIITAKIEEIRAS